MPPRPGVTCNRCFLNFLAEHAVDGNPAARRFMAKVSLSILGIEVLEGGKA